MSSQHTCGRGREGRVQLVGLTCLVYEYSRTPTRMRLVTPTGHGDLSHYTLKLGCKLTRGASKQKTTLKRLRQIMAVPTELKKAFVMHKANKDSFRKRSYAATQRRPLQQRMRLWGVD